MNLRDLKYLVALAEHCHFGKAADVCFVSQPTLSMQIKKLEQTLGVKLLERNNKSVLLTDLGREIAERAQTILTQADEMREFAKLAKDPYSGEIKIGIIPTLAPYLLPHIIPTLTQHFPKLSFYLLEEQTSVLVEKLKHGKIDAAILAFPQENFSNMTLFTEEFFLAVPSVNALAKRKLLKLDDLEHKSLLLLEEGHCLREQALALCSSVHASETESFRATSLETLRHMIAAGVGMTLIPALACVPTRGVTYIPFAGQKPQRTMGLFWRGSSVKEKLLLEMASIIKKILAKQKVVVVGKDGKGV
jgi:LysR family hydrogen peroxide-inducible transcriptional activator